MRPIPAILLAACLLFPLAAAALPAPTVSLGFDLAFRGGVAYEQCTVEIVPDWTLVEVIDASLWGCIQSWRFDGGGILCVDRICSQRGGHWDIFLDGAAVPRPFWYTRVQGGESVEVVYVGGDALNPS